jgi:hypothetical protein
MKIRQFLPPLLISLIATATAAERDWDGGDATSNMTAAANWNGNTVINPGADDLNFQIGLALADRTVNNNYPANTLFKRLEFYDGGYTLNGTIMGITGGISCFHPAGTVTINSSFTLEDDQSFTIATETLFAFGATSQIYLNSHTLELVPLNVGSTITIGGILSGPGNIQLGGEGTVRINGAKNFGAPLSVLGGSTLVIDDAGGLGTGAGNTDIRSGTLQLDSLAALSIPESIRMTNLAPASSTIRSLGGAHTLSGPIEFVGDHFKNFDVEGTSLTLSGSITGPSSLGSMSKHGSGRLILSGSSSNTAGIQRVSIFEGEMFLNKSGGATAISSQYISIGFSGMDPNSAIARLGASHQIADDIIVTVGSEGWFDLNGRQETIGFLVFSGSGRITGNGGTLRLSDDVQAYSADQTGGEALIEGAITLAAANSVWEVDGGISTVKLTVNGTVTSLVPDGKLTKTGEDKLEINGNVSVPLLEVTDGTLTLNGISPATDLNCHGSDAILTGTAGDVTIGQGGLTIGPFVNGTRQTLQCGNFSMANGTRYFQETENVADCDAIIVNGTVTLNQPIFSIATAHPAPAIALGEELVIIENDGTDPVVGSFFGFPEGSTKGNTADQIFVISYQGGDGNDVSLTRIIAPTGVTRIWDGGGADTNWMTANNWNPNGQPQPGDDLVFPTVASRKLNFNNFPAGTTFNSITVHGTGYNFNGQEITLNDRLEFTSATGSHTFSLPITLALDATISVTGNGYVQADEPINLNGKTLTLHNAGGGSGDLLMSGVISGNSVNSKVRKTGLGKVTWDDALHTYLGTTSVQAGTLVLRANAQLGDSAGSTTIDAGATIELSSTIDGAANLGFDNIFLRGRILVNAGAFSAGHGATIEAVAETATIEVNDNTFDGYIITGSVLHKTGTGLMYVHLDNTLTGGLFVDAGEFRSEMLGGGCACPITIGATGLPAKFSYGVFGNQVSDTGAVLLMNPSAVFDIGANTDTMGALIMNGGTVSGTAAGRLTLGVLNVQANAATAIVSAPIVNKAGNNGILQVADGAANIDLRLNGVVYGTAFDKTGAGRVDLMAEIPLIGLDLLNIQEGSALFFNNSQFTAIHLNGGLVGGNGTVGNLSSISGGVIAPGASTGALGGSIGTWNASATLRMELNGLAPGGEYDQYFVNTQLNLGNTTLELSLGAGFDPAPGAEFMIVRNVGGSPIIGTFAGIPENGYVSAPGAKVFQVTYVGGDGDDVVLTRVDAKPLFIVNHVMFPGTEENKGMNGTGLTVQGIPGLNYQLETSTDLVIWTKRQFVKADLLTGLMLFEFFNPQTDPKLFLRVVLP